MKKGQPERRIKIFFILLITILSFFIAGCGNTGVQISEKKKDIPVVKTSEKVYEIRDLSTLPEQAVEIIQPLKKKRGFFVLKHYSENREKSLVLIFSGEKRTGGYGITVEASIEYNDELVILIEEIIPGPDDMVTQALTYPRIALEVKDKYKNYRVRTVYEEEFRNLAEVKIEEPEVEFDTSLKRIPDSDPRAGESFVEGRITEIDYENRIITLDIHKDTHTPDIISGIKVADDALLRIYKDGKESKITFDTLKKEMVVGLVLTAEKEARALIKQIYHTK